LYICRLLLQYFICLKFIFMKNKCKFLGLALIFSMQSCNVCDDANPAADFPIFVTGLNTATTLQRGGISVILFAKCEATFSTYSLIEMQAAITAGDMIVLRGCEITAGKATESSTTTVGSCRKDIVTDRKHTLTMTDIIDNAAYDRAAWWVHTNENPSSYQIAYLTCDGKFYSFNQADVNANPETQDTTEGFDQWAVVATWNRLINQTPTVINWVDSDLVY
jgi:hypothetical protein